jgi:hypothetical protein
MDCALTVMSAVASKPTRDDVYKYMTSLRENGIFEALIYPRSGCEIEYLSEEWFCLVGHFIDCARTLGMSVWLYDDFNWPSGDACGRVSAIPEFRLQAIATKGEKIGQISVESRHNSGLFGEKYFPNLLLPDAVDFFINCTHEEYYRRFKDDFGTVIKGIFTDEPSIGYCCHDEYIPYYDGIKEDYLKFCGRSFDLDMKAQDADFYPNAMSVISERFKKCYIDKIRAWCDCHGIVMTGHLMCDHNPFFSIYHNGNAPKNLSRFSLPGIDEIYTDFEDESEMSLLGLAELVSGENGAMAELFALGPCDMTYQKKRAMIYLCACHKISKYFLAISHMDMRGNMLVKDYFNNFSAAQPDFEGMRELAHIASHASCLAKKDFVADVYVKYPFEMSCKCMMGGFESANFVRMLKSLTENQIQWKFTLNDKEDAPIIELGEDLCFKIGEKPLDVSKIAHKVTVTDRNGCVPKGVFVRRFDDGDLSVINLYAPEGEYLIDGKGVYFKKYDVYFFENDLYSRECVEFSPKFSVKYGNDNLARVMLINSQKNAQIVCSERTEVKFAIRNGVDAGLDGKKIVASSDASMLPFGMEGLYKCTDEITLDAGMHLISAHGDFKYLPSVILIGDFKCDFQGGEICTCNLSRRAREYYCGEKIYGFGTVELCAEIEIPKGVFSIEIIGADLLTSVSLDGVTLGTRAFAPYEYEIPSHMCAKRITIKITQKSSIAPLFGDVDFWDRTVLECGWRKTPSTTNVPFGFSKLIFKF